mgnify:CR=1 FL=1
MYDNLVSTISPTNFANHNKQFYFRDGGTNADCSSIVVCICRESSQATNSDGCEVCPKGTYMDVGDGTDATEHDALTDCKICAAGKYQTLDTQTSDTCIDCPAGTYLIDTAVTIVSHDQLSDCTICGAGKYSAATAATLANTCTDCPTGTYMDVGNDGTDATEHDGTNDCKQCEKGKYQDQTGQTSCDVCVAGKYRDTPATITTTCLSPTTFTVRMRSMSCSPTPTRCH